MNTHITVDFHAHPVDDVFRREMGFLGLDPMAEDGFIAGTKARVSKKMM